MFGDNVPKNINEEAMAAFDKADGVLVSGTSLSVFSAYKFVKYAHERNIPVAIVNIGPTRGDENASLKIQARLGQILPPIAFGRQGML